MLGTIVLGARSLEDPLEEVVEEEVGTEEERGLEEEA